jgi:hypothetical protein
MTLAVVLLTVGLFAVAAFGLLSLLETLWGVWILKDFLVAHLKNFDPLFSQVAMVVILAT